MDGFGTKVWLAGLLVIAALAAGKQIEQRVVVPAQAQVHVVDTTLACAYGGQAGCGAAGQ